MKASPLQGQIGRLFEHAPPGQPIEEQWEVALRAHELSAKQLGCTLVDPQSHAGAPIDDVIMWSTGEAQTLRKRLEYAACALHESIEITHEKRGGLPVVRGTRMPVARLFAEVAEDVRIRDFAANYGIDVEQLRTILRGFSVYLSRPLMK